MLKKYAIAATSATLLASLAVLPSLAQVDRVPGPVVTGPWTLQAPTSIDFSCGGGTYSHTLDTVTNNSDGSFTGTGHYNADNSYTWNITGNISGDNITFTVVYTGTNAGYTLNATGTIASDGSISGTTDGNCQTFSLGAGSAVQTTSQFTGNHGQYVSTSSAKQAAAQSRVGMPVQSNGHTK